MESLRNRVLTCLVERAPNSLTAPNILTLLDLADIHGLQKELEIMSAEGLVVVRKHARNPDYALPSYVGLPMREYVSVNGIKVPRLLANDTARPEELNIYFEVLARRILQIETDAERKLDERLKSYWANVVTLFGAFIGVFALIVGFLRVVPFEPGSTFTSVLMLSSAQVIPLAVILGAFVWFLKSQFK
ncbi:MAG TPA: hypothetical protein VE934_01210 [Polaromonas sp.]|uniref:hypothetical protein n=1 Tax=Polaromonas sp. TaxID=1869339 RepID=UPI002D4EA2A3|nr:hypothetical protein [Polaromonas sp.]HYW55552.1 hypothetical protein [Polaromonas sp.]